MSSIPGLLHAHDDGTPVVYRALGVHFQLDLREDSEGRLRAAHGMILDWLGPHLQSTLFSRFPAIRPFDPSDFEWVCTAPRAFAEPEDAEPEDKEYQHVFDMRMLDELGVACSGSPDWQSANPYTYRFYSKVFIFDGSDEPVPSAVIRLTVPLDHPIAEFRERCMSLARTLPLRWGCAGHLFAGTEDAHGYDAAVRTFARKHPGYDVGEYSPWMEAWHIGIRTVSWLTFVGAALRRYLPELPPPTLARIEDLGETLAYIAGDEPREGDINRLDLPPAYVEVDRLLSFVRITDGPNFMGRWNEAETRAWLLRFGNPAPIGA
jgi:hypothetical protein